PPQLKSANDGLGTAPHRRRSAGPLQPDGHYWRPHQCRGGCALLAYRGSGPERGWNEQSRSTLEDPKRGKAQGKSTGGSEAVQAAATRFEKTRPHRGYDPQREKLPRRQSGRDGTFTRQRNPERSQKRPDRKAAVGRGH